MFQRIHLKINDDVGRTCFKIELQCSKKRYLIFVISYIILQYMSACFVAAALPFVIFCIENSLLVIHSAYFIHSLFVFIDTPLLLIIQQLHLI